MALENRLFHHRLRRQSHTKSSIHCAYLTHPGTQELWQPIYYLPLRVWELGKRICLTYLVWPTERSQGVLHGGKKRFGFPQHYTLFLKGLPGEDSINQSVRLGRFNPWNLIYLYSHTSQWPDIGRAPPWISDPLFAQYVQWFFTVRCSGRNTFNTKG